MSPIRPALLSLVTLEITADWLDPVLCDSLLVRWIMAGHWLIFSKCQKLSSQVQHQTELQQ